MTCLIASAGPSLSRSLEHIQLTRYLPILSVNRAALVLPLGFCDWIVAGDISTCTELAAAGIHPRLGLCLPTATADLITQGHCPAWTRPSTRRCRHDILRWQDLPGFGITWCRQSHAEGFSLTAACALTCHLEHDRALLVGHDATDAPDCGGHGDENRSPERWARERAEWSRLLRSQHLTITTCHPLIPATESP